MPSLDFGGQGYSRLSYWWRHPRQHWSKSHVLVLCFLKILFSLLLVIVSTHVLAPVCLQILFSKMIYYVLSGTLKPWWLGHLLTQSAIRSFSNFGLYCSIYCSLITAADIAKWHEHVFLLYDHVTNDFNSLSLKCVFVSRMLVLTKATFQIWPRWLPGCVLYKHIHYMWRDSLFI